MYVCFADYIDIIFHYPTGLPVALERHWLEDCEE